MKIDWIAAILTWLGNFIIIRYKSWKAFVVFAVANSLWLFYWIPKKEWAVAALVGSFLLQNIWGIISWRRK